MVLGWLNEPRLICFLGAFSVFSSSWIVQHPPMTGIYLVIFIVVSLDFGVLSFILDVHSGSVSNATAAAAANNITTKTATTRSGGSPDCSCTPTITCPRLRGCRRWLPGLKPQRLELDGALRLAAVEQLDDSRWLDAAQPRHCFRGLVQYLPSMAPCTHAHTSELLGCRWRGG